MDSNRQKKIMRRVDITLLLYLLLWVIVLNSLEYVNKFLLGGIRIFISGLPLWLMLIVHAAFFLCLYGYTYLRGHVILMRHLTFASVIIVSSPLVFFSVFTRYVALFVGFTLIMTIVVLIKQRQLRKSNKII